MGSGQELHIVRPPSEPLWRASETMQIFETHLALRVSDFWAAVDHLRSHGYSEALPDEDPLKMVVRLDSPTRYPQAYVLDPDRHLIEFNASSAAVQAGVK
jgi:hypothetical protein